MDVNKKEPVPSLRLRGRTKKNDTFDRLHSQLFLFEKVTMLSNKDLASKDEIRNHLGSSIIYTGRLIVNFINSNFTSIGKHITFEQMSLLSFIVLNNEKEIIQQDLAAMMNKNKSAVLRTIDILEKKGFVKRLPVANDRRKNIIVPTASGIKIVKDAIKISHKFEKEYTKKISDRDLKTCLKVLQLIQTECLKERE